VTAREAPNCSNSWGKFEVCAGGDSSSSGEPGSDDGVSADVGVFKVTSRWLGRLFQGVYGEGAIFIVQFLYFLLVRNTRAMPTFVQTAARWRPYFWIHCCNSVKAGFSGTGWISPTKLTFQ
jgi:hypothetical protein